MELGMSAKKFWALCWYDLNLWIEKIIHKRKSKNDDREFTMEMTRQLMSLIYNISGKTAKTEQPPTFFMKLSYDKVAEAVKDERKPEEVLSKFPKTLHGK